MLPDRVRSAAQRPSADVRDPEAFDPDHRADCWRV